MSLEILENKSSLLIHQRKEMLELIGFETRNKYEVLDESGQPLFFIAEGQKGIGGMLLRQYLGHWRSFELGVFDAQRRQVALGKHPFRFIFPQMEVSLSSTGQSIGYSQKQFSILSKKYSIHSREGLTLSINSGLLSPWTFKIERGGVEVAKIKKNWSGALKEVFTDADNFTLSFEESGMPNEQKLLLIMLTVLVDLNHFERKAR